MEVIICLILLYILIPFLSIAPWYPTRSSDLERIKEVLQLKPKQKFLEVGCGNAKVSLFVSKEYPKCHITGIEFSLIMYTWSKIRVYLSGQKNIKIIYGNALKTDFGAYDVVYIFGMPDTLVKKLLPRLQETVKENFRLVSYCFQMKNGFFDEKVYKKEKKNNIYEYRVRKHHHI